MIRILIVMGFGVALGCRDDPYCRAYSSYRKGACSLCFNSVVDSQGRCDPFITLIDNCDRYERVGEKVICKFCAPGYFLSKNKTCRPCKAKDCAVCFAPGNKCAACSKGLLASNGQCILGENRIDNCEVHLNEDKCLKCKVGNALDSKGMCVSASPLCEVMSDKGLCSLCRQGASMGPSFQCEKSFSEVNWWPSEKLGVFGAAETGMVTIGLLLLRTVREKSRQK